MDLGSVGRFGIEEYNADRAFLVGGCEDHSAAFNSAENGGLEICDENDLLSDQLLGLVEFGDPRRDLTLFVTEIKLKLQKLFRLRNGLT